MAAPLLALASRHAARQLLAAAGSSASLMAGPSALLQIPQGAAAMLHVARALGHASSPLCFAADAPPAGSGPSTSSAPAPTDVSKQPAAAPGSTVPVVDEDDEWTEVVHHESGKIYYWNERTGETTQLGDPRPGQRSRQQGGQQGGEKGEGAGSSGGGAEGQRAAFDPRSEAPMEDKTGTYAAAGVFIGAFLGWASQFL